MHMLQGMLKVTENGHTCNPFAMWKIGMHIYISMCICIIHNINQLVDNMQNSGAVCESGGGRPGLPSLINLRFLWM